AALVSEQSIPEASHENRALLSPGRISSFVLTHSPQRARPVLNQFNTLAVEGYTSSGSSIFRGAWTKGVPSGASGYSKNLPSNLGITRRSALRLRTYSGLTGTLPPPPGASITYWGTA